MPSSPETLLRRDLPLDAGRRLRFAFTIEIDVPLTPDDFPDDEPLTLTELEHDLAGAGKHYSPDDLYRGLLRAYEQSILDYNVWLEDVGDPLDDGLRFERLFEQHARENGDDLIVRSRVWLDEIPPSTMSEEES